MCRFVAAARGSWQDAINLPNQPFGDCRTRQNHLSYMEVVVPADARVIVRTVSPVKLPCIDTYNIYPIALDVLDVTSMGMGKTPQPRQKSREPTNKERELKNATRQEEEQWKLEMRQKRSGKAPPGVKPVV